MMSKGFSLIELMVVIAIIAILAAVATPAYKSYAIRAKIAGPLQILERVAQDFKRIYTTTGAYPATYTFAGQTVTNGSGTWTAVNTGGIIGMNYAILNPASGVVISVSLSGLSGVPAYVAPPGPNWWDGVNANMHYGISAQGDTFKVACGTFVPRSGNTYDIPIQYLGNCNCANVRDFAAQVGAGCLQP